MSTSGNLEIEFLKPFCMYFQRFKGIIISDITCRNFFHRISMHAIGFLANNCSVQDFLNTTIVVRNANKHRWDTLSAAINLVAQW